MELPMKSATEALRIKKKLRAEGIRAYVSKRSGENGCYYLLMVPEEKYPDILRILDESK